MYGMSKCPLKSTILKESCSIAGISVGGSLQNNRLITDAWNDKPNGCFLDQGEDNAIHFNTNPIGKIGDDYVSVCHKIEVSIVVVPLVNSNELYIYLLCVLVTNSYAILVFSSYFVLSFLQADVSKTVYYFKAVFVG